MSFRIVRCSSIWKAALLASLSAAACGIASCGSAKSDAGSAPTTVAVVKVTRQNISSTLEIASEFQPYQEIDVFAKVSGYVRKLYVNWGTHVRQGQALADLEVPELEQQVQQDEAMVRRSQQDLERSREELNSAESSYNVAHLTYTRIASVQNTQPGLVAQQEVDVAQGKDEEATAAVSAAKDALSAAQQSLLSARAALEKDKALFGYTHMTAPFDGVITQIYAYTGALLPAGTASNKGNLALCRLSQNDLLRLVIPLPERAVPDVRVGQTVSVNVTTLGKTLQGKVARFSDEIDLQTRTMYTEVDVPNLDYALVAGMYVSVAIPLHAAQNVLTAPLQAIQLSGENKGSVLVVNGSNRIERRDVTLGIQTADKAEIVAGLSENDEVVLGEQDQYKPGQLVSPKLTVPGGSE
ncbi:MAG: efflux RND transporter periplasmic adaptor subunit [Candidatus Acidiferrales bacterium]